MRKKISPHLHILILVLSVLTIPGCSSCSVPFLESTPIDPQLKSAIGIVGDMLLPANLMHSGFAVVYPEGKPSDYISYAFSQMGVSEWPMSEEEANLNGIFIGPVSMTGSVTIRPKEVAWVPYRPDQTLKKQVVLKADDEAGVVIVEAYADPQQAPILTKSIKLPKVTPDPNTRIIVKDNLSMGMSPVYHPAPALHTDVEEPVFEANEPAE